MSPFVSKSQVRYMFKNHPKIAERFAKETLDLRRLPEHITKKKNGKSKTR